MKTNLIKTITVKTIIALVCTLVIGLAGNIALSPANAASWVTDGWTKSNNQWVLYKDSKIVTGWLQDGEDWYYLASDGAIQTGDVMINGKKWHFLDNGKWDGCSAYDEKGTNNVTAVKQPQAVVNETLFSTQITDGWLKTDSGWQYLVNVKKVIGWKQIDGKWYDFDSNGIMLANTIVDNKYKIGANGVWDGKTYVPSIMEDSRNRQEREQKQASTVTTDNSAGTISYDEFTKIADTTMLNLVNAHRAENGADALTWDSTLAAMATEKSNHMIKHNYFDHSYNDVLTCQIQEISWKHNVDGENILANYSYPITEKGAKDMSKAMFNQWKASSGHDKTMLDADYSKMGFGFEFSNGKAKYESYGAQQFAIAHNGYEARTTLRKGAPSSLN